jgi:membrane associated rhomboid family serine protease
MEDQFSGIREYVSFFLIPVLGIMVQIPFENDERARHSNRWQINNADNLKYTNKASGRWWTVVTHMFLHQDPEHLFQNALVLIPSGGSVANNFGVLSTYAIFLGGGIFAALEGHGREYQDKQQWSRKLALPDYSGRIGEWWDKSVRRAAPYLGKYLSNNSYMGCSAGVAALQGMNAMVWLEQLLCTLWFPHHEPLVPTSNSGLPLLVMIPNMLSIFNFFAGEARHMSSGEPTGIDHAGHLAGFCFGIGCFGVTKAFSYMRPRPRNSR